MPLDYATLELLRQNHPAWRLLCAHHAPLVASFLYRVFIAPNVRVLSQANLVEALEDELFALREQLGVEEFPGTALLENLVFTALRRVMQEIFYHKTRSGREVDLVALLPSVQGQEQTILLVQVCDSLADHRVSQSKVRSLSEAMVELAVAEGIIFTWRTDENIPMGFGTILVGSVWRFLLEMELRTS